MTHIISITELANREYLCPVQTPAPARFAPGEKADVVIIGAGYTGLSAALHLAKEAHEKGEKLDVVVLEASRAGAGASGKSCGHVNPGFQQHDTEAALKCFSTRAQGEHILSVIDQGPKLLEKIVTDHRIDCDLRKGYVLIHDDSTQSVDDNSDTNMGIEPYPYVLGLAEAARKYGVKIYEATPVSDIVDHGKSCDVRTGRGTLTADHVLCAGGHAMGETIPFLSSLRARTFELKASTIVTDPLPPSVIKELMPGANGKRYPFCNDLIDVSYGTVDRRNRIIFGSRTRVYATGPEVLIVKLDELFPNLKKLYRDATGRELGYKSFVSNEKIHFTADLLPHVGRLGKEGRVRYVQGLGGHGVALGTVLGKLAADEITGANTADFSLLAGVKHMRLPTWKPLRLCAAWAGVAAENTLERLSGFFARKGPGRGLPKP